MTGFRWDGDTWGEVESHVFSTTDREVGGILAGRFDEGETVVTLTLLALAATSGSANVTFTHEVWEQVHATLDKDHPDERIVGWYHSHPGFGVFLSEYDTFAHRSFFPDPRMFAVVVDPHSGEAGWFAMRDGEPVRVGSRRTDIAPLKAAVVAAGAAPAARRRGVATTVGLVVAAALAGFFIGGANHSRTVVRTVATTPQPAPQLPSQPTPGAVGSTPSAVVTVPPGAVPPEASETPALTYIVRAGDSLWSLAASFYGDPHLWGRLQAANPQHPSPGLTVGEKLNVPVGLNEVQ